jgi:putative ABC transport system permease protein
MLRGHQFELGVRVDIDPVAPDYFRTLGIPLRRGRDFTLRDGPDAPGVVIISERLAQRFWPGEDPIGQSLSWPSLDGPPRPPLEVIGIAADSRYRSLASDPPLLMYVPVLQNYDGRTTIVVRSDRPTQALGAIQRAVTQLDPTLSVYAAETMRQHMAESLWAQRVAASWISAFGVLALVLSALGLYGVIAQSVIQRTRELSIRVALGAEPSRISRLVVREGLWLAVAGILVGAPAAVVATRAVRNTVSGATAVNPLWMIAVVLLLGAVMLLASYLPARRAARANPVEALRCE